MAPITAPRQHLNLLQSAQRDGMEPTECRAASPLRLPPTDMHTGNLAAAFPLPVILPKQGVGRCRSEGEAQAARALATVRLALAAPTPVPSISLGLLRG